MIQDLQILAFARMTFGDAGNRRNVALLQMVRAQVCVKSKKYMQTLKSEHMHLLKLKILSG